MPIDLSPEQKKWLGARVAGGEYASVEDAVHHIIDEYIADYEADEIDDMAWAAPYVDEARAAVARGETVALGEHKAFVAELLATFRT